MNAPILDRRLAAAAAAPSPSDAGTDLVRLFGLDRLPLGRQLVCRWRRDRDGRLACVWAPDIPPVPGR